MSLKHIISYNFLFLSALLLSSCVQESDGIDVIGEQDLVINSISSPAGLWKINLSQSALSIDDISFVDNAIVRIEDFTENQEILFEYIGDGNYKSIGRVPQKGHNYELFVETEQHGLSTSRTYVPSIGEIVLQTSEQRGVTGGVAMKLDLSISNIGSENNFYVWEIINEEGDETSSEIKIFNSSSIENDDDIFIPDAPSSIDPKGNGVFVFTEGTNAETFNTSLIAAQAKNTSSPGQSPSFDRTFEIRIKAVSEDLFEHMKSLNAYNESTLPHSSSTIHNDIFSNIENGIGIFGAYTEQIIIVN